MSIAENNLLVALHRWAAHQDENFLTEAFVHLLRHALAEEAVAAMQLLDLVTGGRLEIDIEDLRSIGICAQTTTELGRPDVEIRAPSHLVYVEAKVESGLGFEQLKRYRKALRSSGHPATTLVLLSRYSVSESDVSAPPDVWLRWFEVGDLLVEQLGHDTLQTPEGRYLARQLVGFLRSRGMMMDRVGWEMPSGIRSLKSLMELLAEAIADVGLSSRKSSGWTWMGYWLDEKKQFWIGVGLDEPHLLRFSTEYVEINPEQWANLGVGRIEQDSSLPAGHRWRNDLELESEDVHFFARSRASQQQVLEEFIRRNMALATKTLESQA